MVLVPDRLRTNHCIGCRTSPQRPIGKAACSHLYSADGDRVANVRRSFTFTTYRATIRRSTDEQLNAVQRELEPTVYLIVNTVVQRTQQLEYLHSTTGFVRSTFDNILQRATATTSKRKQKLNVRFSVGTNRLVSKNKLLALQYLNHKNRYPKKQQRRRQQGQRQRESRARPQKWQLSSATRVREGEGNK